ncbi:signal peptidase II [Anaerosporobacter faecicola]|uniref:signal peptidase II n=1 Tax=Anaerosporobacter faecicola TaxID=2718714 RepID=UPI00143B2AD9|nr:signal peptidase II [Anaerosporobacter faecicola]
MKKKMTGLIWVILLVIIDQITKIVSKANLEGTDGFDVIKKVFKFVYHENRGMAFGMLQNKIWLFVIFTVIVVIALTYVYFKLPEEKRYLPIQWILIFLVAGALGNCIDRVVRGYVVDFLYFELIDFPVFNVADCYVTVSCFVLVLLFLFYYKDEDLEFLSKDKKVQKES